MKKVEITKKVGPRKPGTVLTVDDQRAAAWIDAGVAIPFTNKPKE